LTQSGCMLTTWLCSGSMSNVELDMMYLRGKEAQHDTKHERAGEEGREREREREK